MLAVLSIATSILIDKLSRKRLEKDIWGLYETFKKILFTWEATWGSLSSTHIDSNISVSQKFNSGNAFDSNL